jgi:hypothetical protein
MIERLERLLEAEERRLELETDAAVRQTTSRTVVMLCAELRKAQDAERKASKPPNKADILEAIRRLPPAEREQLGREVVAMGAKRSGLA